MDEIPNLNHGRRSLLTRFFGWRPGRRLQRRVMIAVGGMVTLIAVVYARVNWHGKEEWENCKRDMTARGEVWDWSAYAPAPVPDDQNIFKAPKMAEWFGDDRSIMDAPLDRRLTNSFARRYFNPGMREEIKTPTAAAAYLAWSDEFQNDFDTVAAALKRPCARLVTDYSQPFSITFPNVASLYAVVNTLEQRARCHLILGQTDKAWQELTLLRDLRRMVAAQDKFITPEGDSMRRGVARHCLRVIAKGLELHAWRPPQLETLQEDLGRSDFIALHVEALKCGRAFLLGAIEAGEFWKALFMAGGDGAWTRIKRHPEFLLQAIAPRGADYERATSASQSFRTMITALTPATGVIRPGETSKAFASWRRAQQGLPGLLRFQTLVNEGQIACALERYRLAHGRYPETLGALLPQYLGKLPRDIVNGAPLKYRRTEDGNFLLYSVGWNETDDGGKSAPARDGLPDATQGDWVWQDSLKQE